MALYNIIPTDWGKIVPRAKQYTIEHAPQILTGIGLSSLIGAGIIAVRNTPAAYMELEDRKAEEGTEKLPLVDILRIGAKYYVVPAGMTIAGSFCIVKAIRVATNRADAFAALAATEAIRLKDYKETTKEKIGEKKAKEIEDEVARKTIDREYPPDVHWIEETGHGEQIVHWPLLGRWFKCDIGWIRRVENDINKLIDEGDINEHDPYDTKSLNGVPLNRLLGGIGLEKSDLGLLLGWNGKNRLHITFTDIVTGQEAEKAVVLEMHMDDCMPMPKWDTVRQDRPQIFVPF